MMERTQQMAVGGFGARWALGALCALGLFGGLTCSGDFDPYNRLNSLRVLAIRSEPAVPARGETATLNALVYAPSPVDPQIDDSSLTYDWSWCPFPGASNDGYPCLVTEDQLRTLSGDPTLSFQLGNGPTASLQNQVTSDQIKALLCDGMGGVAAVDCTGGFPIQIKLTVSTATGGTVKTIFRSRWGLVAGDANNNPALSPVSATVGGLTQVLDVANSAGVSLLRGQANYLSLDPKLVDESETYQGLDDNGQMAQLQERLFVSWFVETGDTRDLSTGYIPGMSAQSVLLHNTWTPPGEKKYPAGTARMYLVVRDSRAGVGWFDPPSVLVNLASPSEPAP